MKSALQQQQIRLFSQHLCCTLCMLLEKDFMNVKEAELLSSGMPEVFLKASWCVLVRSAEVNQGSRTELEPLMV